MLKRTHLGQDEGITDYCFVRGGGDNSSQLNQYFAIPSPSLAVPLDYVPRRDGTDNFPPLLYSSKKEGDQRSVAK